jgi:hypothetical protein
MNAKSNDGRQAIDSLRELYHQQPVESGGQTPWAYRATFRYINSSHSGGGPAASRGGPSLQALYGDWQGSFVHCGQLAEFSQRRHTLAAKAQQDSSTCLT